MTSGDLLGFRIGVTADSGGAELVELISRRGGSVVHTPFERAVDLSPVSAIDDSIAYVESARFRFLAVCSVEGFNGFVRRADELGVLDSVLDSLARGAVLATNPACAGALVAVGLRPDWVGCADADIVEYLRARLSDSRDPANSVAVVTDGLGSPAVVEPLQASGAQIHPIQMFHWEPPSEAEATARFVERVSAGQLDAVAFSSVPAVLNFFQTCSDTGRREAVLEVYNTGVSVAAAADEGTASALRDAGVRFELLADAQRPAALIRTLAGELSRRAVRIPLEDHSLELRGHSVLVDGVELCDISQRELGVLRALVDRRGAVVSKASLLADVWGEGDDEHVVEVTVARLRGRLGDAGTHIETVVRRGYRLAVATEFNGANAAGQSRRRSGDRVGLLSGGS